MLRLSETALWRAGRRWAWAGGFGLLLSGAPAGFAQDCAPACAAPGGCAPVCAAPAACGPVAAPAGCAATAGPDCCAVYEKNARDMRSAYDRLATSATGCGTVTAGLCDAGCDGGCDGAGCGDGCELGEPFALMDLLGDCLTCDEGGCDGVGCDGCDGGCEAEATPFMTVGGWVQNGYHDESTGQFNNRPGRFANHQTWLYAEREADGSDGLGFGFRGDFMYGLDADDTQSFGNNVGNFDFQDGEGNFFNRGAYGFAIPQLYAEAAYGDFSVIAGHFYTLLGYEVVTAPDNFFYSHAFTMYNAEAFTHTGVLSTYNASDDVTFYNGYTFGWDTGFDQFQDIDGSEGSNYLGGASVALTDALTLTYITTIGDLGFAGEGYTHSVVADWAVTDRLNYVFQTDYFDTEQVSARDAGDTPQVPFINEFDTSQVQLYSVNQYLFYTLTDRLAVGGRAEWFKVDGDSIYEITGGVNVRPTANLVIRPEYRYHFGDANGFSNIGDGTAVVDEGIFAVDAVMTF